MDHCHPISHFSERKLKTKGILNDHNKEYFTDWNYFNSILNLQMLDSNENKSKSNKDLNTWIEEYSPSLKKHYLPKQVDLVDFPIFIKERMKLLNEELKSVLSF